VIQLRCRGGGVGEGKEGKRAAGTEGLFEGTYLVAPHQPHPASVQSRHDRSVPHSTPRRSVNSKVAPVSHHSHLANADDVRESAPSMPSLKGSDGQRWRSAALAIGPTEQRLQPTSTTCASDGEHAAPEGEASKHICISPLYSRSGNRI